MTNEEIYARYDAFVRLALQRIGRELRKRGITVSEPEGYPLTMWAMRVHGGPRKLAPEAGLTVLIHMHEEADPEGDMVLFALEVRETSRHPDSGRELSGISPADWASRNDESDVAAQIRFYEDPEIRKEIADDVEVFLRKGPKEWSPRWHRPSLGASRAVSAEDIKNRYQARIMAFLEGIRNRLTRIGFTAEGPGEAHDDEYKWDMMLYPPGLSDADDVRVTFTVSESETVGDRNGVNFTVEASTRDGNVLVDIIPFNYTERIWVARNDPEAVEERFAHVEAIGPEIASRIARPFPKGPKEWRPGMLGSPEMGAGRKMSRAEVAEKYGDRILDGMRTLAQALRKYRLSVGVPHPMHDPPDYQWWMVVHTAPHEGVKDWDIDIAARITSELEGDVFFVYDISTVGGTPIAAVDSEPASLSNPKEIEKWIRYLGSPAAIAQASKAILEHVRRTAPKGPKEWSPRWTD